MHLPLIDRAVFVAYLAGVTLFGCSFYFRKEAGAGGRLHVRRGASARLGGGDVDFRDVRQQHPFS